MRIDSSTEFAIRDMVNSCKFNMSPLFIIPETRCPSSYGKKSMQQFNVYATSISYATHLLEKYLDTNIFIQKLVKPPRTPFQHLRDPTAAKVWDFAWLGYRHPATRPSWDHAGHDWYPPIGIGNKLSHSKLRRSIYTQQFAYIMNHSYFEHPCTTNKSLSVLLVLCIVD